MYLSGPELDPVGHRRFFCDEEVVEHGEDLLHVGDVPAEADDGVRPDGVQTLDVFEARERAV